MKAPKFEIKRYVRLARGWRYCPPAYGNNNKAKPNVVVIDGKEETFLEGGAYYLSVKGQWVKAGDTIGEAQAERTRRIAKQPYERATGEKLPEVPNGTPLAVALARYFSNLEAQGKDPKAIQTYRSAVDPFVAQCKKRFVEEIGKQDLIDYMGWLRRQPVPQRKHGNPERTYSNKIGHVAIFLKTFGVSKLLKSRSIRSTQRRP
jgi:integrase/recombinase XerD